jgi:hypothetical protein
MLMPRTRNGIHVHCRPERKAANRNVHPTHDVRPRSPCLSTSLASNSLRMLGRVIRYRAVACHGVDVNAIEDRRKGLCRSELSGRFSGLPPKCALLQQHVGMLPFRVVLRSFGYFLVPTIDDYACPAEMTGNLIDRYADSGICAHPLDFSPEGRKSIQMVSFECEVHWHHIGFIVAGTSEVAKPRPCQKFSTLFRCHLCD